MWLKPKNIIIAIVLLLLVVWSADATQVSWTKLVEAKDRLSQIMELWFPPNWSKAEQAFSATLLTLQMAFLGSFIALVVVLPLSFLAAKNTAPNMTLYHTVRGTFSFLRSVPDIVIGLILVMAVGLGPFPAVIAIMLHNVGVLGKLISELIEAAEKGPQEAIQSLGLGRSMIALYGVMPQIFPNVLSQFFYRFEVAIRTSLILGFIGAGGIGQLLFNSFRIFHYADVTLYVIFIMALVILVDMLGSFVRNRII
ncbi:phosphonate ABC transporter, permease protein PhnE [Desulfuribacillus alkaliarsenatis]|uniref:Phosphonate ABC transporter, permease protein PhnE n=1 Tax=Desulfuribacillus alkaliarsenatis TaxID=766136 RepID=A0A1E5FZ13_9FIRM|nr:phosphonate ABC transporter, permease protein PhnE [Desulfuribacillus alkaliarsenatis]OEF95815.1 phosphonate ABC transporter, permease protein PhnE [Desulfuribacillus alkaliarsenatis]